LPTVIQKRFVHELQAGTLPATVAGQLKTAFIAEYSLDPSLVVEVVSSKGRRDQFSGFRRWQALVNVTIPEIYVEFDAAVSQALPDSGLKNIAIVVTTEDGTPTKVPATVAVRDLLTGTSIAEPTPFWEYTFEPNPKTVVIPAGTAHGATVNVQVDVNDAP
jgi:hypothetical protein